MIAAIVGGVVGAAIFAFILYTGWERMLTRWRDTDDPLQRAAQVVVAALSILGLLGLLTAGGGPSGHVPGLPGRQRLVDDLSAG